jgi:hypothetical protein
MVPTLLMRGLTVWRGAALKVMPILLLLNGGLAELRILSQNGRVLDGWNFMLANLALPKP